MRVQSKQGSAIAFALIFLTIFAAFAIAMVEIATSSQDLAVAVVESRSLDYYAEVAAAYFASKINQADLQAGSSYDPQSEVGVAKKLGQGGDQVEFTLLQADPMSNGYLLHISLKHLATGAQGEYKIQLKSKSPFDGYGMLTGGTIGEIKVQPNNNKFLNAMPGVNGTIGVGVPATNVSTLSNYVGSNNVRVASTPSGAAQAILNKVQELSNVTVPSSTDFTSVPDGKTITPSTPSGNYPGISVLQGSAVFDDEGELKVDQNSLAVISAGTYQFKELEAKNSGAIIIDATQGPVTIVAEEIEAEHGNAKILIFTGNSTTAPYPVTFVVSKEIEAEHGNAIIGGTISVKDPLDPTRQISISDIKNQLPSLVNGNLFSQGPGGGMTITNTSVTKPISGGLEATAAIVPQNLTIVGTSNNEEKGIEVEVEKGRSFLIGTIIADRIKEFELEKGRASFFGAIAVANGIGELEIEKGKGSIYLNTLPSGMFRQPASYRIVWMRRVK